MIFDDFYVTRSVELVSANRLCIKQHILCSRLSKSVYGQDRELSKYDWEAEEANIYLTNCSIQ